MTPEEAKLNEKIALFSGFNIQHYSHYIAWYYNNSFYCEISRFKTPEEQLPNFLDPIQGMGLMFEYVIPKLLETLPFMEIRIDFIDDEIQIGIVLFHEYHSEWKELVAERINKDPTTALALAVEKLIEEG